MATAVPRESGHQSDPEAESAVAAAGDVPVWDAVLPEFQKRLPGADLELIRRAFEFARVAHAGARRRSGDPYLCHPLAVALILADMQLDQETIAAGLLHDVLEDTDVTPDRLREEFGPRVARLVDGVTKLGKIRWSADEGPISLEREKAR
ncbi:MAG: HD domain-containing protein, partial [Thermomicrobium sp.]|nr:HD domain-containing protein [Thermomicrobium sp.]